MEPESVEPEERVLPGGSAVRVGDVVRKPAGRHSAAVRALLAHLHATGADLAPVPIDGGGAWVDCYAWIDADAGKVPLQAELSLPDTCLGLGRLLRRYHDATADFALPDGATWPATSVGPEPHEVICHNDLIPQNLLFGGGAEPTHLIDFDQAGPGSRHWDLALAAWQFVPLARDQELRRLGLTGATADRSLRLNALLSGYGLALGERRAVIDLVPERLRAFGQALEGLAADGDRRARDDIAEGALASIERDLAWCEAHLAELG